jgi:hypothetical protein
VLKVEDEHNTVELQLDCAEREERCKRKSPED